MKIYKCLALLFLLIYIFPGLALTQTVDQPSQNNPNKTAAIIKISTKQIQENSYEKNYSIDVCYPHITSDQYPLAADHLNQFLMKQVDLSINSFKQAISSANLPANLPKAQNYLKIDYVVKGVLPLSGKAFMISIRLQQNQYQRGMAHPEVAIVTVNYDLKQDHVLKISDLFKKNENLNFLAHYAREHLTMLHLPDGHLIHVGTEPTLENYQRWNLTPHALLIVFDEAQVAPRYFGIQEISVPHTFFSGKLNPSYKDLFLRNY